MSTESTENELHILRQRIAQLEAILRRETPLLAEQELRLVADATPVCLAHCGCDGRYLFVNRAYAERLALTPSQVVGRRIPEVIGEAAYESFRQHVEAVLSGTPVEFETEIPYERIGSRFMHVSYVPDRDERGGVRGLVAAITDITARKRAEEAVRDSEQRLRFVTDNARVGLVVVSREHRYRFANQSYADILSLPSSDLVGRRVADVLAPVYDQQIRPRLEQALRGERVTYELALPMSGGLEERRYSVVYEPSTEADGTPVVVVVIFEITERVRAELALAQQFRLTKAITDNATTALFIIDDRQQCVFLNPAAEALTGYTLAEIQGRALHDVVHHTRPDGSRYPLEECPIDRAFPENNQVQGEEMFVHKDGSFYPVAYTASPMRSGAAIIGTVVEVRDIRQEKAVHAALRGSNEQLRRANQVLEQFAYSASHDLQEPLRNVAIYSQLLSRRYGPQLAGEAVQFLGYLLEGAQRMEQLVADLLIYTQADGQAIGTESRADAERALDRALSSLAARLEESGGTITRGPLPTVSIPGTQLEQLFMNLVGNALKYRKDDQPPQVSVSAVHQNGRWRFAVSDNGIGIAAAYQQRIFGLFKRLHGREKYAGTGIGLALCQKIVERHGGEIWVESEEGQGSTFYFTVPE